MILHPKILIISADDARVQTIEQLLQDHDYEITVVQDVLLAMAVLKSERVDAVLLDEVTGEIAVTDAIRILKCLRPDEFLPVLCLFASIATPTTRAAILDAGADDYQVGAIDPVELQARLRKLLTVTLLHRELLTNKSQLENALARESQLLRQLRNDNRRLKQSCITDGLTSLYNHRYLMEWLKTEFKIARRYGHPISFLMADLDHFKQVNDVFGHPFGDFVLKEVAVLAKKSSRDSDLVARYGGEEFAVVLPRTDAATARVFAERFHDAVRSRTFQNGPHSTNLTVSIGLATYPFDAEITSPEVLVYLADQALLQSKAAGRNTILSWHELELDQRVKIRSQLAGPLGQLMAAGKEVG